MENKYSVSMFGQKRLTREGGVEIVVKSFVQEWQGMDIPSLVITGLGIM